MQNLTPSNLFTQVRSAIEALLYIWQDARVPELARFLFIFGLAYFFIPSDCFPDFLPGGYIDDAGIALLISFLLRKIVPKIVFQDAQRAAAQAACGLLCFGFAGINLQLPHAVVGSKILAIAKHQTLVAADTKSSNCMQESACSQKEVRCSSAKQVLPELKRAALASTRSVSSELCNFASSQPLFVAKILEAKLEPLYLLFRGGHGQTYVAEDSLGAVAKTADYPLVMPPKRSSGGITFLFVTTS